MKKKDRYYMYVDESGDEGQSAKKEVDFDPAWFTVGGIIVKEENIVNFDRIHTSIMKRYFPDLTLDPSRNFKLHYNELRQGNYPYDEMTRLQRRSIADDMFDAINSIDCTLISASIHKPTLKEYDLSANVRAYALSLCQERFQYFLIDQKSTGRIVYERFQSTLRKRMHSAMRQLQNSDAFSFTKPDRIKGRIINGDPTKEKILQFVDFFVYAPHIRMVSGYRKDERWNQIKNKYYLLDGPPDKSGFMYHNGDSSAYPFRRP